MTENVIIAPWQWKKIISSLNDELCKKQAFLYLSSEDKFGYSAPQDILISYWTFVEFFKRLNSTLNQTQIRYFWQDVYEQYHLLSSIKLAMHEVKHGTVRAGTF